MPEVIPVGMNGGNVVAKLEKNEDELDDEELLELKLDKEEKLLETLEEDELLLDNEERLLALLDEDELLLLLELILDKEEILLFDNPLIELVEGLEEMEEEVETLEGINALTFAEVTLAPFGMNTATAVEVTDELATEDNDAVELMVDATLPDSQLTLYFA